MASSSTPAFNPIFAAEQKAQSDTISWELGENGSPQLTEYGLCSKSSTPEYVGALCALNAKLTRGTTDKRPITKCTSSHHSAESIGCDESQIKRLFSNVIDSVSTTPDAITNKVLLDLVIMMFNLRDIRGDYGKGERTLSYWMFFMLYSRMPGQMNKYIQEIPNYGSWADLNNIYAIAHGNTNWSNLLKGHQISMLKDTIANVYAIQINNDLGDNPLSLAAKWIPKEGRSFDKKTRMGKHIAKTMYPSIWADDFKKALRKYRKDITYLTRKLDVPERKMASTSKEWANIDFKKVPGRCMAKHTKAWNNVDKAGNLRTPDHDRVKCAENYQEYIRSLSSGTVTAKGQTMFVHELAMKLSSDICSPDETILYESMMDSHIDSISEAQKKIGNTLGNTVIIADVSGSMSGEPMAVAYAMAVIASHPKIANPAWANKVITFSNNPEWISIQYPTTYKEYVASKFGTIMGVAWDAEKANTQLSWTDKLKLVKKMPWGGCTNFISTLNLVATRAIEANMKMPNILCVSDMQWDSAASSMYKSYGVESRNPEITGGPLYNFHMSEADISKPTTLLREVKKILKNEPCGDDFTTIMWNVRGGVSGHAGAADEAQFVEVSGFSTNMLKVFLNDGTLESKTGNSGGATSWSTLRVILDHTDYDRIREIANLMKPWRNTDRRPLSVAENTLLPNTLFIAPTRYPQPSLVRSVAGTVPASDVDWAAASFPAKTPLMAPNIYVDIPSKKTKASSKNLSSEDSSEWSYDFDDGGSGVTRMNTFPPPPAPETIPPPPAPSPASSLASSPASSPAISELVKRMAEMEVQNQKNMAAVQLMITKLLEEQ